MIRFDYPTIKKLISGMLVATLLVVANIPAFAAEVENSLDSFGMCGENATWSFEESTGVLTITGTGDMYTNTLVDQWGYYPFKNEIKEVVVDEGITTIAAYSFGPFDPYGVESTRYPNLTKITLPETIKSIEDYAFYKTGLEHIELPEGLEIIGVSAFSGSSLSGDLTLPKTLKTIGQSAFSNTGITSVDLNEGMTLGGNAFSDCNSLKVVTIAKDIFYSGSGSGNAVRENAAFSNCKSLEKVIIHGGGIVYIALSSVYPENGLAQDMFMGCTSLKEVTIKNDDISYLDTNTFDMTSDPTFYIYKDSTTEATLRDAGYLTDSNVVYIANKTVLEGAVKSAEDMDVSQYTPESVVALNKAIEAGKAVIANETATQEDADNAVKAIEDAIEGLEVMQKGSISGTITAPGVDTEITVTVTNTDGEVIAEATATDGKYTVSDLEDGEYTIIVTAENCVPRSYDVTVADGDATLDAEIHLKGDINGDGEITTADVGIANSHAQEVSALEGYDFDVAEVTGDGEVTTADVGAINSHVQSVSALW